MRTNTWVTLLGINLGIALLVLSPFLPGPSNGLVNSILNVAQMIGPFGLIIFPFGLYWTLKEVRRRKGKSEYPINLKALILLTLPVTICLTSLYISAFARGLSRDFAIHRAEGLIQSIEKFKMVKGTYPDSLSELPDVPSPLVMGIEEYTYEKQGGNYTISFSQNVLMGFNFEVVIFDPNDNHKAEGELVDVYDTGKKHWKYFVYD